MYMVWKHHYKIRFLIIYRLLTRWDVKTHKWQTSELLRPLTVNLDFRRGNKTVFKSVHFAGYVGVLTGIRPNRFTFSINERFDAHGEWLCTDRKW